MSHGLPTGQITLYDKNGNAFAVAVGADGRYRLEVADTGTQKLIAELLELAKQNTKAINGIAAAMGKGL